MASITQTIPNYTHGISQQPDQLKNPGQVSDATNVIPEIETGLVKRPGTKWLKNGVANGVEGTFFHYYRDQDEQYIGHVSRIAPDSLSNPQVKLWALKDIPGTDFKAGHMFEAGFANSQDEADIKQYLKHTDRDDLQFLTINDYTYILNRNPKRLNNSVIACNLTDDKSPGWGIADTVNTGDDIIPTGDEHFAYIELKKTANARQYSINLNSVTNNSEYTIRSATKLIHKKDYPSHTIIDADGSSTWAPGTHADRPITSTTNATGKPFHSRQVQEGGRWNGRTDGTCVDINTDVFSSEDSICTIYDVNNNLVNSSTIASLSRDIVPKNLIWRFTVKGRSATWHDASNQPNGEDYVCKYDYDVDLLHGGEGWKEGDYIKFIMVQTTGPDTSTDGDGNYINYISPTYFVKVKEIEETKIKVTIGGTAGDGAIRPVPTAFDADMAVSATTILGGIQTAIGSKLTGTEVIGNGLYLKHNSAFTISTADYDLMNIVTSKVNDVTKLPTQCKHGMVVKVSNSDIEEDDYYMRFVGSSGQDGPGAWEECVRPGIRYRIDPTTMPIQVVRKATGDFKLQLTTWTERQVGDNVTNPKPSLISRGISLEGDGQLSVRRIQNMTFWRNRVVFLSGTNVICSQPGGDNLIQPNLWAETALTITPTDSIDLSTSSDSPAQLYEALELGQGLLLFSENQQWLLGAEAEILNPDTAKITPQATYNFNTKTQPISMGTTVGFLDNAGKYSKFFEATRIQKGYEPEILNQSISVADLLPKDINLITNSRENTYALFAVEGTDTIYGYRYFNTGEKRVQSAWFKWKLDDTIRYFAVLDDVFYIVHTKGNLVQIPLVDKWANWINSFPIHLDNWTEFAADAFTYDKDTNKTTFSLSGYGFDTDRNVYVINVNAGNDIGRYDLATVTGSDATLSGDWASIGQSLHVGYNFDMEIKFPTIYPMSQDRKYSDVNGSLVVHRLQLALGAAGVYETTIERTGKDTYEELIESSLQDDYLSNKSPWVEQRIHTLPTYEKNENLTVYLKSTHPSPTTLYSMSWEGDYTNKFYQRA